jgi:hypothetical protein
VSFEKTLAVLGITKGFSSSGSRGGESASQIAIREAGFQVCTAQELM